MLDALATPPFDASATLVPFTGAFITWLKDTLVDARLAPSPAYEATIAWLPVTSAFVTHAAERALPLPASATVEQLVIAAPLSVKRMEPVGAFPVTVAVSVTLVPVRAGFAVDETAVEVVAGAGGGAPPVPTCTVSALAAADST